MLYKRAVGIEPLYGAIEWQRPKPAPRVRKAEKDSEAVQHVKPKEVEFVSFCSVWLGMDGLGECIYQFRWKNNFIAPPLSFYIFLSFSVLEVFTRSIF